MKKIICKIFGHNWRKLPLHYFPFDIICIRCKREKCFEKVDGYKLVPNGYIYNGVLFNNFNQL